MLIFLLALKGERESRWGSPAGGGFLHIDRIRSRLLEAWGKRKTEERS